MDATDAEQQEGVLCKQTKAHIEAEAKSIDGKAGQSHDSSRDAMGHTKADTGEGVDGGKKQERHH